MLYYATLLSWQLWSCSNVCKHLFLLPYQPRTSYQQNIFLLSTCRLGLILWLPLWYSLGMQFLIILFINACLRFPPRWKPASMLSFQQENTKLNCIHFWFSPACTAAIAYRNHFFWLYHLIATDVSLSLLVTSASSPQRSKVTVCW